MRCQRLYLCSLRAAGQSEEPAGVEPDHDHAERPLGAGRGPREGVQSDLCSRCRRSREHGRTGRDQQLPDGGFTASTHVLPVELLRATTSPDSGGNNVSEQTNITLNVLLLVLGTSVSGHHQHHPARAAARHHLHRLPGACLR